MAGILAGGHAATTTYTPSKITIILLLGVFIGAIWRRFVVIAAVLVGLYLASLIPHVSVPADAVLVLVLIFAFIGFIIGGPAALKALGEFEYRNRLTNMHNFISGFWGKFWGKLL